MTKTGNADVDAFIAAGSMTTAAAPLGDRHDEGMTQSFTAEALGIIRADTRKARKPKPTGAQGLTRTQRKALDAMPGRTPVTPYGLSLILDTSPEGAAATASSLVRRGLVERVKSHDGHVMYRRKS